MVTFQAMNTGESEENTGIYEFQFIIHSSKDAPLDYLVSCVKAAKSLIKAKFFFERSVNLRDITWFLICATTSFMIAKLNKLKNACFPFFLLELLLFPCLKLLLLAIVLLLLFVCKDLTISPSLNTEV